MARATSSLPVPLSPWMTTGSAVSVDAIEQAKQLEHARRAAHDVAVVVADGERLAVLPQLLLHARELLAARRQLDLEAPVERLDLALAAPQLGEQARVLDGDGGLLGEVEHELDVVVVEGALAQAVVDVDVPTARPLTASGTASTERRCRSETESASRKRASPAASMVTMGSPPAAAWRAIERDSSNSAVSSVF